MHNSTTTFAPPPIYVPPACLVMEQCYPTLSTVVEMINVMTTSWLHPQCLPIFTSMLASDIICVYNFTVLICYTTLLIFILTMRKLNFNFRVCIGLLYLSDSITLIMSAREAVITGCALDLRVDLNLVWQGAGGGVQDLLISTNLLMAYLRFHEATHIGSETNQWIPSVGAVLSILICITTFFLHVTGNITYLWYDPNGTYEERYLWPFQYIRIVYLVVAIFTATVFYIACAYRIVTLSSNFAHREKFILFTSASVFVTQLVFTYATFWMGCKLGIGDVLFNANLSYFGRPLCSSVAPMLYLCSSSMRSGLKDQLGKFRMTVRKVITGTRTTQKRRISLEPVSVSTIRASVQRPSI
ncbi:unnamed protein product, partial [Mesorhabditis belari]|uniref:Uncharacterized protein n=1 Tax=Mesorhabditis belari TaxID=2138241 RepID=A0AAF3FME5_9BILA